ncbi:hypothetical protein C8J55DRAFT_554810 [Lentinula edodes]|uniref:Uncharacterized protein n=1 Tax=Lentinula lateritia TaxID=40482 RepID=A0A9W9B0Q7_9AGAR|nr:hypothetical protein C8J55DRAFT_554810 [Lentinula edodes]
MTGANYMGGKRNAAKARVRDSASRAQKKYFGAQRLNLAANRGSGMTEKSGVNPILDLVQTNGFTKSIPDIKLAHARQNSSNTANQIVGYIPDPIRVSPCTPKSQLRLSKISMDSNHSRSTRIKPSRVLQALDTCEPFALRAAMDEVLSLSDLAGLSRRPGRNLKRQHSSSSPCPREESHKQHKTALQFLTSSDESTFTSAEVSDLGPSRQESSSDFEEAVVEAQFAFNIPDDDVLGKDDEHGHSSDNNGFATWTVYPNRKTDSPEMVRHIGPADRSLPRLSEPKHLNVTLTSPSYHVASENPMEYPHISNLSSQTTPGSNIFDYEDPWMAIGVMLGVEKTPLKPLKKRDFRKILAEIPTPVATPTSNVNIFATNHLVPDLIIAGSSSPSQLSDSKVRVSPSTHANTDAAQNPFRIFSPSVQTQPIFPNAFHSLVPYSSDEAIFDHLSSATHVNRSQPVLDFSIDQGRGIVNQTQSDMLTNIRPRSGSSKFSSPNYGHEGKADSSYLVSEHELPLLPNLRNDLDDVNTNDHRASNRAAHLSSSPLFGRSLYSSSSHTRRGQALPLDLHRRQRHELTHMHDLHHVQGGPSNFQEVAASQGGDHSSPLLTPIQFALSPRRLNFDPKCHVDFPFSAIAEAGDEYLHTPEQRTRIGTYKNRTPHDDTGPPTIRLVTTTKQSTAASPSIVNSDVSSPNDLQLHASQSDQLRDNRRFAPASIPRLNPRTKLSTELDTSLHRAPARYRSPAVCPTNATENLPRTPQTRRSPLFSRFNASHAVPLSQSTLATLFLNSPARQSARNHSHENTSKEIDIQDNRQSTREDNQKTEIPTPARSIFQDSTSKPEDEEVRERGLAESNVGEQPVPSAEAGSEKHSSRVALRFSLFADDEIESDSESE